MNQLVQAPERPQLVGKKSIFLAGTTTSTSATQDWRTSLTHALGNYPIAIFNPCRPDWDWRWTENSSDSRWTEQVEWELDMLDAADLVVVLLSGATSAPISMLELGLVVGRKPGGVIVCAEPEYSKRGNVMAVCERFGAPVVSNQEALAQEVEMWLKKSLI